MAQYVNDPVPKYRQEDIPKTVKQLHGYTVGLTDQLQYLLANLDADNVPELDAIEKRLTDADGNITRLDLTAQGLSLAVRDHDDQFAALHVTVDGIQTAVGTMDGALSTLTQTAQGLESRVSTAEGQISTVTQTAGSLTTRIGNAEGSISSLQQTANGLSSRVSNAEGRITTVTQTASGLQSTVSDLNGKYTKLKQTVDGFDFTGMVTFEDLTDGKTKISGDNILTGTISAERIDLSGAINNILDDGVNGISFINSRGRYRGGMSYDEDYGLFITSNDDIYFRADSIGFGDVRDVFLSHVTVANDVFVIEFPNGSTWEIAMGGIYFYDKYGDLVNKCVLQN